MTSIYEPWEAARGAEIIAQHTHLEGATLVILHALQEAFGYVPEPAIPMIASALNLSRAEVHGVFTFTNAGRMLTSCRKRPFAFVAALVQYRRLRIHSNKRDQSDDGPDRPHPLRNRGQEAPWRLDALLSGHRDGCSRNRRLPARALLAARGTQTAGPAGLWLRRSGRLRSGGRLRSSWR